MKVAPKMNIYIYCSLLKKCKNRRSIVTLFTWNLTQTPTSSTPTSRIEFSRGKRSRPTELADNPFKNSHRSLVLVLLHRRLFISPSFEESCGQTFHDVFVAHAREPHSIVKTKGLRETFTKSRNVRICVYKTACIRILSTQTHT